MHMIALSLSLSIGCVDPVDKPLSQAAQSEVSPSLLAEVGPVVILPALSTFKTNLQSFNGSLDDIDSAIAENGDVEAALATSKTSWTKAFESWQELEMMQIGPAGSSLKVIGGEDLRDEVYSWPTINGCLIDQKTVTDEWLNEAYYTDNLVNAYGIDAIEHLLYADLQSECPSQVPPISDGSWYQLEQEENGVLSRRMTFAKALVSQIDQSTDALINKWSPEGENFSLMLEAEDLNTPYADRDEALYAVFLSLFYVETMTKDRKLGQPLGIKDCSDEVCPEDVEAIKSQLSLRAIRSNLIGFKNLFSGGDSVGMDDLLTDIGHEDLAVQILSDVDAAIATTEPHLDSPLDEMIVNDKETVTDIYDHIGLITTAIKQDLTTVLQVEIPSEVAGDND